MFFSGNAVAFASNLVKQEEGMTQMPSSDVDYKIFDFFLRHCLLWLFWWEILAPKRPTVSAK